MNLSGDSERPGRSRNQALGEELPAGITANPSRHPGDSRELPDLYINDAPAPRDREAVERWVAGVLRRARESAEATEGPHALRGILYVAHCFADELATANPRFDRLSFITAVTEGP
jgi:hypothetical protein